MVAEVDAAHKDGDTLGGVVEVLAYGLPPGLGSHVHWDRRLDARLAAALMGIQAIKGVEVGDGFRTAARRGSQAHDEMERGTDGVIRRRTGRAGGTEGGMSTGEVLRVRAAMKPISTVPRALETVDVATGEAASAIHQRSDVCAVPAAGVVAEAMVALVLAEACLEKFGGDSVTETARNHAAYLAAIPASLRTWERLMARVVLVGPPGSGKSTVGGALAERLGLPLHDTDAAVEAAQGRSISDIFVEDGEPAFRELERAEVARAVAEEDGVLALGGGAPDGPRHRGRCSRARPSSSSTWRSRTPRKRVGFDQAGRCCPSTRARRGCADEGAPARLRAGVDPPGATPPGAPRRTSPARSSRSWRRAHDRPERRPSPSATPTTSSSVRRAPTGWPTCSVPTCAQVLVVHPRRCPHSPPRSSRG